MRMYRSQWIVQGSRESSSSGEYLEQCRAAYVGRLFTLVAEVGSALVQVASISDDCSVKLVRQSRASCAAAVVMPLAGFLAALEVAILLPASRG